MAAQSSRSVFLIFLFCISLSSLYAIEELDVIYAPESIKFRSSESVRSSYLGDIFSAMLAYTFQSNIPWHSLAAVTPWKRPEAIVVLELAGFNNKIDLPLDGTRFLFENAGDLDNQFDLLSFRTEERYFGKRPVLLHMELGKELHDSKVLQPLLLKAIPANPTERLELALADPELGELVKESTFNTSLPGDVQLLTELATIKEFLKALNSHKSEVHNNVPDVLWLKISGLKPVLSNYGEDSFQFQEAMRLLRQMVAEVERTMRNIYDDNIVIAVIKVDDTASIPGHSSRRLLEVTTEKTPAGKDYNLAAKWDPMFPVTFAIMVFVSILLILSVFGISVAMWHMDPGRDSIIYRMTSQRMKKD